jgi:hypothetical protein
MESDKEIKFISSANTQIKFYNKNIHPDVFRKIEKLLRFQKVDVREKITASMDGSPTRQDIYFDHDWRLADNYCSLSIRSYKEFDKERPGSNFLTAKFDEKKEPNNNGTLVLARHEVHTTLDSATAERFTKQGISTSDIKNLLKDADLPLPNKCRLIVKGQAYIRRSIFFFEIDGANYQISVDKFYFYHVNSNRYSETYTEIEIESKDSSIKYDQKILDLCELLPVVFDIQAEAESKYQRFRSFSVENEYKSFFFVGWDISGYSKETSLKQKQVVQRFHKIIKDSAAATGFTRARNLVSLSIGDGAILAADTAWQNIEELIRTVHDRVAENNKLDGTREISYRTAIHWGSVFPFTDLNDSINIAGEGINTVNRLLSITKAHQVIVSKEVYDRVIDLADVAGQFKPMKTTIVKHGKRLKTYQYTGIDNAVRPANTG